MDMIVSVVISVVSRTIGVQLENLFYLNRNIKILKDEVERIQNRRDELLLRVDEANRNGEIIKREVEAWLHSANGITAEAERMIDEIGEAEMNIFGWVRKFRSRYICRELIQVVDELQGRGNFDRVSIPAPPPGMVSVSTGRFKEFKSRMSTNEEVLQSLKDDGITMIGICGMGGIGKTTMVKDVATIAKMENLFDEIVMAVATQSPSLWNIQGQIADMLGLKLEEETLPGRATRLHRRLVTGNRILLVLDDVWEWLDLEAIGIPLVGWKSSNRGFKVVLTSRSLNVCSQMGTQKNITVKILTEEEAWHLFKDSAGDSVDAPDIQPVAEQVVNECKGLPLALITLGRTLRDKSIFVWTDALQQLRMPGRMSRVNATVYHALVLSYNFLEEEAKSLFLLCCLFPEDHDIQIEGLVRFGMGLRLFQDINRLEKARDRVCSLVYQLKSCYLLSDGDKDKDKCVKLHDVVRDVGISIASEGENVFLISHGDSLREWPKKVTHEHYTSISVISGEITRLPEGLSCPRLRMLLLACMNHSLITPDNFFDGMRELQVLNLELISIPLLPSSLQFVRNLQALSLQACKLEDITVIGELLNLEILCFRGSSIEVLPEEIGRLVNLSLLDLTGCHRLERIPPDVISRLLRLQELYIGSFSNWEADKGESKEERRNASLRELQSLSDLNILEIYIPDAALLPRNPLFANLTKYKIRIGDNDWWSVFPFQKHLLLKLDKSSALHGGISMLLKCTELLSLKGKGSRNAVQELVQDGVQHLKELSIESCDTLFCLADTMDLSLDSSAAIFPILESLKLEDLHRLEEICHGQLPAGSFGEVRRVKLCNLPSLTHFLVENPAQTNVSLHNLRSIELYCCNRLGNICSLSIARGLVQLQQLRISYCGMMEEVIWKERGEDGHATNKIEFPSLEYMQLKHLDSFTGFGKGIGEIELPQLKTLHIKSLPKVTSFFPNRSNLYSNGNNNATLQSIFPQKVTFPGLEELEISGLPNASNLWCSELSTGSFCKLRSLKVEDCHGLVKNVVPADILKMSQNLEKVEIYNCDLVEEVFGFGGHQGIPLANIRMLIVRCCSSLRNLFSPSIARALVHLQELTIDACSAMEEVVANEDDEQNGGRIHRTMFPQLKHLELRDLP